MQKSSPIVRLGILLCCFLSRQMDAYYYCACLIWNTRKVSALQQGKNLFWKNCCCKINFAHVGDLYLYSETENNIIPKWSLPQWFAIIYKIGKQRKHNLNVAKETKYEERRRQEVCAGKKQKKVGAGKKRPESSFQPASLLHAENSHLQRGSNSTVIFPSILSHF